MLRPTGPLLRLLRASQQQASGRNLRTAYRVAFVGDAPKLVGIAEFAWYKISVMPRARALGPLLQHEISGWNLIWVTHVIFGRFEVCPGYSPQRCKG